MAAPSLAASGTLLAIAALAAVSLFVAQRGADRVLREMNEANQVSNELEDKLVLVRHLLFSYAIEGDDRDVVSLFKLRETIAAYLVEIESYHVIDGALVGELDRVYGMLNEGLRAMQGEPSEVRRRQIANQLVDNIRDEDLLSIARRQREATNQAFNAAQLRSRELTRWTGWTLLLLGVAGSGAGALAGFGLARSLRRQLVELSVPIRTAAGSLDEVVGPVQVRGGGEVEDLEDSLNSLAGRVADVVERLQAAERES
ncbi:MAG: hypothetical protein JNG89_08630, partial [Planctomycetaceae bacterium]|nr:hypothetical protein [Planctomycetaceae bacterium]